MEVGDGWKGVLSRARRLLALDKWTLSELLEIRRIVAEQE